MIMDIGSGMVMPANASALVVAKATFENVQRLAFPSSIPEANWKASKDKS